MPRYRSRTPEEIAIGLVNAQAALVRSAQELERCAAAVQKAVDPLRPFAPGLAVEAYELFATAEETSTTVRREITLALAAIYPHPKIAAIVGMSQWWVGKVIREAGRP
ncbi:hypothetical protein [Rhodococcus erythropolis]|jgi:hypothetical protein|uniref:Uncharacterized protein n=1 Tax=Rhodococcus erythropolis TaxID=1833 RepID=A0A8I1D6F4_RHOER|nr:hypothetical protein [Rhodococcus erythropolis]MBH5141423.1 hypothetical protein [Rhodococcus erythropolis]